VSGIGIPFPTSFRPISFWERAMTAIASTLHRCVRRAGLIGFTAILAGLLFLVAGCAVTNIPPGEALMGPLPPLAPGDARLVFYRPLDPYATQSMPTLYLNGVASGITQNGGVLYRDVLPGQYDLTVEPSLPWPYQFKTVVVRPGDVFYISIETRPYLACGRANNTQACYGDTFILTVVDPNTGAQDTQGLRLIRG
jgi:hypothetical protein